MGSIPTSLVIKKTNILQHFFLQHLEKLFRIILYFLKPIYIYIKPIILPICIAVYLFLVRIFFLYSSKTTKSTFLLWNFKLNIITGTINTQLIDKIFYFIIVFIVNVKNIHVIFWKNKQNQLSIYNVNVVKLHNSINTVFYGIFSIFYALRLWVIPVILATTFIYVMFLIKTLPFLKLMFTYFLAASLFYLLISGFVFFFKKYQYRYYTTAIQRFWRRTLIIFWFIEGCLFITFFYLTINANQEPIYMYDNIQFYKTHLFSWRYFFVKIVPTILIIVLLYTALVGLNFYTFTAVSNILLLATVLILFVTWTEFYQFFHLLNYYGTLNWVYDIDEHLWNLEAELKRTRIINHYTTICLIAKFWHIVFAVIFWVFFILRSLESERYRYPLLASNIQNFIIIYVMSWLYMFPWLKYIARKALDMPFYWFFINNRKLGFFLLFNDIKLFFLGIYTFINNFTIPFIGASKFRFFL